MILEYCDYLFGEAYEKHMVKLITSQHEGQWKTVALRISLESSFDMSKGKPLSVYEDANQAGKGHVYWKQKLKMGEIEW